MTALAYGQLATQDEYEVALRAAGETRVQANVRRNRIGQFTAWARRAGIQHPAQVTWDEWSHWLLWLDHESGYKDTYRRKVLDAVLGWLQWAHEQGYRGPVTLGELLPQSAVVALCREHLSRNLRPDTAAAYHQREAIFGLVFAEGWDPDTLAELSVKDYDLRAHTLAGRALDPRSEQLLNRHLGQRLRGRGDHLISATAYGHPAVRREARLIINRALRVVAPDSARMRWMPHPERDAELVLGLLAGRPKPMSMPPRHVNAGALLQQMLAGQPLPAWWD